MNRRNFLKTTAAALAVASAPSATFAQVMDRPVCGGYLVPPEFAAELERTVVAYSRVRVIARSWPEDATEDEKLQIVAKERGVTL